VNLIERAVRAVDGLQQRRRVPAFLFAVVKKYGDDRGPSLAALIAFYGFLAMFPLLLLFTTVLGFIGNDRLQETALGATLSEFPVFGEQIGRDVTQPLEGSTFGLAIGLAGLLYGSLGVSQAAQHAMAQLWNVPGVVRPGFLTRIVRSMVFFLILASGLAVTGYLSGLATGGSRSGPFRLLALLGSGAVDVAFYLAMFRALTPRSVSGGFLPGAIVGGLGYALLLALGTSLVQHQLRHAEALYGQFGFVLGLLGWLYLVSQLTLYAAELNVVLARRLWPRSIVQPPLTDADERVLRAIAEQEERRPEQGVGVGFDPAPDTAPAEP